MKKYYIYIFLFIALACKKKEISNRNYFQNSTTYQEEINTSNDNDSITDEKAVNYHENANYKYEYRRGNSENYEYNYDVLGYDENGNEVSGNITMEGKFGAGKITDTNGTKKEVEAEWYDHGKIKAVDENRITYKLTVD